MKWFYKKLCQTEVVLSGICLIASVALIFLQAILRTLDRPINWGFYIALFLFTWSTFLAADVAYRNNTTVYVDVFINRMPQGLQKALRMVCYLLSLAFMVGMVYYGAVLFVKSWARPYQGMPGFSYSWVTLSVPVGFGLMAITTLRKMYYDFVRHEEPPVMDIIGEHKKKKQEEANS